MVNTQSPQDRIIDMGAEQAAECVRTVWTSHGTDVPFRKTAKRKEIEQARLEVYCRILDSAFGLGTSHACRVILFERAVENGLLVRDESHAGGYALPVSESDSYGELSTIPVR